MATNRICSVENCPNRAIARGYCGKHWSRWSKYGDPLKTIKVTIPCKGLVCSIPGCGKPARSKGWCPMHYCRWRLYGDPLTTIKPVYPNTICSVDSCQGPVNSRGLCRKHYIRWSRYGDPTKQFRSKIPIESFWLKVNKDGPIHPVCGQCWAWTGHVKEEGYGRFRINKVLVFAHRFSWEIHRGEIPDDLCICHHCDNPGCVNPAHLFLGTRIDNNEDARKKGRRVRGEKHPKAILTEAIVKEIRQRYKKRDKKNGGHALAKEFGIRQKYIYAIALGHYWKHVI